MADATAMVVALKDVVKATKTGFKPHVTSLFEKLVNIAGMAPKESAALLGALPAALPLDKPWYVPRLRTPSAARIARHALHATFVRAFYRPQRFADDSEVCT